MLPTYLQILTTVFAGTRARLERTRDETGSVTLEQVVIALALFLVAYLAMAASLQPAMQSMSRLIGETWTANDLRSAWLQTRQNVSVINAHFEHWRAIPARRSLTSPP